MALVGNAGIALQVQVMPALQGGLSNPSLHLQAATKHAHTRTCTRTCTCGVPPRSQKSGRVHLKMHNAPPPPRSLPLSSEFHPHPTPTSPRQGRSVGRTNASCRSHDVRFMESYWSRVMPPRKRRGGIGGAASLQVRASQHPASTGTSAAPRTTSHKRAREQGGGGQGCVRHQACHCPTPGHVHRQSRGMPSR